MSQSSKTITFVTGNPNKLEEFRAILGSQFPHRVVSQRIDLPEYQGTSSDVTSEKCREAARRLGGPVIVEDTSLCLSALGGLPGPYIKWFVDKVGPEGIHRMLIGFEDKSATAMCIFAYTEGVDAEIHLFEGRMEGTIVEPRGSRHYAWDPCFVPEGYQVSYAEMEKEAKNSISHYRRAIEKIRTFFGELGKS